MEKAQLIVKARAIVDKWLDETGTPSLKTDVSFHQPCVEFAEWLIQEGKLKIDSM